MLLSVSDTQYYVNTKGKLGRLLVSRFQIKIKNCNRVKIGFFYEQIKL